MQQKDFQLNSEQDTENLAKRLAKTFSPSCLVFFQGNLGVGKTTLVRYILRALGIEEHVKSPSYTLVESYPKPDYTIYHFDFYRLDDPEELEMIGIRDYFQKDVIAFVEWPEKGADHLPLPDLEISLEIRDNHRQLVLIAKTDQGNNVLQNL